MPISFASQMGGTLTLIGTSTNLLVAGLVLELGMERIRLFDITPPALVLTALGCDVPADGRPWLTPTRETETDLMGSYDLRRYLTGSDRPGRDRRWRGGVCAIRASRRNTGCRSSEWIGPALGSFPRGGFVVEAGDVLIVEGQVSDIARIEQIEHLQHRGHAAGLSGGGGAGGGGLGGAGRDPAGGADRAAALAAGGADAPPAELPEPLRRAGARHAASRRAAARPHA
jgi:hypothetical protein